MFLLHTPQGASRAQSFVLVLRCLMMRFRNFAEQFAQYGAPL